MGARAVLRGCATVSQWERPGTSGRCRKRGGGRLAGMPAAISWPAPARPTPRSSTAAASSSMSRHCAWCPAGRRRRRRAALGEPLASMSAAIIFFARPAMHAVEFSCKGMSRKGG